MSRLAIAHRQAKVKVSSLPTPVKLQRNNFMDKLRLRFCLFHAPAFEMEVHSMQEEMRKLSPINGCVLAPSPKVSIKHCFFKFR
jgi:hypothetical protein